MNNYSSGAENYSNLNPANIGTGYLSLKNIGSLITKYTKPGATALDYGCGAGRSTNFLFEIDNIANAYGVDVSDHMLLEARKSNENIKFLKIIDGKIPLESNTFDLILSTLVLFEFSSKAEMTEALKEIKRVMKPGAKFIAVTGSEHLYTKSWNSIDVDFPQNQNLKSGDMAKVYLKNIDLYLEDYFWTNQDYLDVIELAGLKLVDTIQQLGDSSDPFEWKDETKFAPFITYLIEKSL